jgi:hypothetical protein
MRAGTFRYLTVGLAVLAYDTTFGDPDGKN